MLMRTLLISLFSLILGVLILLYLDVSTLFLSALLIAIVSLRSHKAIAVLDKVVGVWFALSVAPAFGIELHEIGNLENGFLVQALFSFAFFLYFYIQKPSIIARLQKSQKENLGLMLGSIIAGFAGGILSAVAWQVYLKATGFVA